VVVEAEAEVGELVALPETRNSDLVEEGMRSQGTEVVVKNGLASREEYQNEVKDDITVRD